MTPPPRIWSPIASSMLLALLLVPASGAFAQDKTHGIAGYTFGQISKNATFDRDPRVSRDGKVVWVGHYNLPGATSGSNDDEIMYFDGTTTVQITDDDTDWWRPVVNDAGQVAYQGPGNFEDSDMYLYTPGVGTQRLTDDTATPIADRYPDISQRGVVVFSRLPLPLPWQFAVFDPLVGAPVVPSEGYRPHINELDHVVITGKIVDLAGNTLVALPNLASFGWHSYRRAEINDFDQVALEIDPTGYPDLTGPRILAFWDGTQLVKLFETGAVWGGRPDLNNSGVVAFESQGGLPGSSSGPNDFEIFVYDPAIGRVIQLTDDDLYDAWGTVTSSGRIVWRGNGSYDADDPVKSDNEIYYADPSGDADSDGIADAADNCALEANTAQTDSGGIGTGSPDGIGDACQCGDVSDDGVVDAMDGAVYRLWLADPSVAFADQKCSTAALYAGEPCSVLDTVRLRRALAGLAGPGIQQGCGAEDQW